MKNTLCWTLILSMLLFFTFTSTLYSKTIKCNPDDRKALLQTFWGRWDKDVPEIECCQWYGLECDFNPPYHVKYINIRQADISGQIPAAIGDLPELRQITLKHLPNLTGTIPPSIIKLNNLIDLDITYTNLSGPIPTFLTKLENLNALSLSFNHFTGSIPPEFSQFKNLQVLYLNWNKLTGTIPESFGQFTGIVPDIHLSHNQLTGPIPKSLGNSNSTFLDLSHNNLTGDASFLFGKNNTVQHLDLSRNNLTFDLSKVEFPESLRYLDLSHNNIYGSIPQQLIQLDIFVNVSYNRLCGQIPQGGNLQNLDNSSYFHNRCLCGAPLPAC